MEGRLKITIEPTDEITTANGAQARIWTGVTERGTKVLLAITRIAVPESAGEAEHAEFRRELTECPKPPLAVELRHVL